MKKVTPILTCICIIFLCSIAIFSGCAEDDDLNPNATIIQPNRIAYLSSESIIFSGSGKDFDGKDISGNNLTWTSNLDGHIGVGSSFEYTPSIGDHKIILTAKGEYKKAKTSVSIQVVQAEEEIEIKTISYNGEGSNITDIFHYFEDLVIFYVNHDGVDNFIIELVDMATGEVAEMLINKTGIINELIAKDLEPGDYFLEVKADGLWEIKIIGRVEEISPSP